MSIKNTDEFAPPGPGNRWYVKGYVKKSGTSTPISSARVDLYNDGVYIGRTYTSSTGYFSISTTRQPTNYECGWQITVSKSGYVTTRRYATPINYVTNFGNVYLTTVTPPSPPTPAVISNVEVTIGGIGVVTISWDVDWDDTSTGYLSKCWWSTDASMDAEDLFFSTTTKQASYSVTVPIDMVPLEEGTCYYQIYARNSKNGYYPETYYGPEDVVIEGPWTIAPTDDAYTQQYDNSYGNTNYNTDLLYIAGTENTGLNDRAWLKFNIANPTYVVSATLNLFFDMYYPSYNGGYGDYIDAYCSDPNWDETSITHNNAPLMGNLLSSEEVHLPPPYTGIYHQWDVTDGAINCEGELSITLCARENSGPYFYSKEALSHQPYLEIQYSDIEANTVDQYALIVAGETDERFTRDAYGFYDTLIDHYGFTDENIYLITPLDTIDGTTVPRDRATSRANVEWATNQLENIVDSNDRVIIWWTGHGNVDIFGTDADTITATQLDSYLDDIICDEMFIILGACHSGSFINDLDDEQNRAIYTSCMADQEGYFLLGSGHSLYPWATYRGLDPNLNADDADVNNDNKVSLYELFNYCVDFIDDNLDHSIYPQDPQRWVGTAIGDDANSYIEDGYY